MSEFQATAVVSLELPDGEIDSFEDRLARAEIGGGGGGGAGAMTSLAEDRNDLLRQLVDEVEDGALGAAGGGGGGPAAAGTGGAGALGRVGGVIGTTGAGVGLLTALGSVAMNEVAKDEADKTRVARGEREIGSGPVVEPPELQLPDQSDIPELDAPELPELPDLPEPQPGFFPEIPDPDSMAFWPDIPEPEDIGVDIPDELQEIADALTGGGASGGGTRPNSSVPNNLMNPEGTGTGSLSVDVSDFGIDIPTGRELEREIQSTVESLIEEYLEREVLP
jgi:hypothetical protein